MFRSLRLVLGLSALLALLVAGGSAHAAATVTVEPLASVPSGIGIRNSDVYVVQPGAQLVTDFRPDTGARVRELGLPGGAGAATSASLGPSGLWVGIGSGAERGFASVDDSEPAMAVHSISTAAAFGCGPTAQAYDAAGERVFYAATQPAAAPSCGTHGVGAVTRNGTSTIADGSFGDVSDLFATGGKLLLLDHDTNQLRRLSASASATAFAQEAAIALPTGSGASGLTLGADGQVWITLRSTGQVIEVPIDAPSDTQPRVVADGLQQPVAIAGNTYGGAVGGGQATWVASADGRLERFRSGGAPKTIALPAGFAPGELVAQGRDVWVLDTAAARVAHISDGASPEIAGRVEISGTTASLMVDPAGSDAKVTFLVQGAWPNSSLYSLDGGTVAAGPSRTATASLATIPPGDYYVFARAVNEDGTTETIVHRPYTVAGPPSNSAPPVVVKPAVVKPKAAKLADLVSYAATKRCVATRTLKLTLRKLKAGQSKVVSLRVTVGKHRAKTYTAKQLKKAVKLSGLPKKGTVKVKVVATRADHAKVTQTLSYKICAPKKKTR